MLFRSTKPLKYAQITIRPNPIDAQPTDDYGYTTDIIEWPTTEYTFANGEFIPISVDSMDISVDNTDLSIDIE